MLGMPSWVVDFLGIKNIFKAWVAPFNWLALYLTRNAIIETPAGAFPAAWTFLNENVVPWFTSAGLVLLNLFFLIGFARSTSNIRENITTEMWIEQIIKVIIANTLMANLVSIVTSFCSVAVNMSSPWLGREWESMHFATEVDLGTVLYILLAGIAAYIISVICGVRIFVTVLGRFLDIYILIATGPIALSAWAGGRGLENTAYSWIKALIATVFQIVVITLILSIGNQMSVGINGILDPTSADSNMFDGAGYMLINICLMLMMSSAVKGSGEFMRRAFDLR